MNQDAPRRVQIRSVSGSPNPGKGRSNWPGLPRVSPIQTQQRRCPPGLQPSANHPQDPTGLTCPSLGRKGGTWRLAAGTRGLGGCRVPPLLITPLPRQSLLAPGVPLHTPNQGKRPAATPGRLHFASALQRGRRSASTRGGWPGRAGYTASGPGRGDPDGVPRGRAHAPPIASCSRTRARLVGC